MELCWGNESLISNKASAMTTLGINDSFLVFFSMFDKRIFDYIEKMKYPINSK